MQFIRSFVHSFIQSVISSIDLIFLLPSYDFDTVDSTQGWEVRERERVTIRTTNKNTLSTKENEKNQEVIYMFSTNANGVYNVNTAQ